MSIEKEKCAVLNELPSECGEEISQGEQYKIDTVVKMMRKNAEWRDVIYQFTLGLGS